MDVEAGTAAEDAGLQRGDVIVSVNGSSTPQCPGVTVPVQVPARALVPSMGEPLDVLWVAA